MMTLLPSFSAVPPLLRALAQLSAIASILSIGDINSAQAVQLANGTVYFDKVPRLIQASTTFSETDISGATYYFEIDIPADAGESLKQVQIQQTEGVDRINFNLQRTRATLNTRRGAEIPLESAFQKTDKVLTLSFQDAIAPGNTVILALKPYWNPNVGGVYLFGVTAFPEGSTVHPQFLGYGRLHFYEDHSFFSNHFRWHRFGGR